MRSSESELAGGMPEGTGMWLRCREMSAHFHIHLCFGTLACILPCILRQNRKLENLILKQGGAAGLCTVVTVEKVQSTHNVSVW